jgi:hypothetical protein
MPVKAGRPCLVQHLLRAWATSYNENHAKAYSCNYTHLYCRHAFNR